LFQFLNPGAVHRRIFYVMNFNSIYSLHRVWISGISLYLVFKVNFKYMYSQVYLVTVTILTISDLVLWRLQAVTMRLVLESFKSLVLASSFWDFLWLFLLFVNLFTFWDGQLLYSKNRHSVTVTNVTIYDDFVTCWKRLQWRRL
jgi:hypothetical protein